MTKVILYIATSADSFIADESGNVDWLPHPNEKDLEEIGHNAFLKKVKTIAMGSRSYKQTIGFGDWQWPDKKTYVFTSQKPSTSQDNIYFENLDPEAFMEKINAQDSNQNVWLFGGAELIKSFAKANLIDECSITIIPTILGKGIKLELPYRKFKLISAKPYRLDIVQKIYVKMGPLPHVQ